jgi:hypothetical protein
MISNALRFLFITGPFWGLFLTTIGVIELLDRALLKSGMAFWYACFFALIFIAVQRKSFVSHGLKYRVRWFRFALAAAVMIMPFLPAVYESFLASSGNFPGVFFGVDSPYHLSQVFSLLQSNAYPPESLNNKGVYFNYHYGIQLVTAAICEQFGLRPHFVYFALVPGLFLVSAIFCVYFLILHYGDSLSGAALFFLFLGGFYYLANKWDGGAYVFGVESFNAQFPHISSLSVVCLFVFFVYVYESFSVDKSGFLTLILLPAVVLLFKSPFIFHFAAFLFGYLLIMTIRRCLSVFHVISAIISAFFFFFILAYVENGNAQLKYVGFLAKADLTTAVLFKIFLFVVLPFSLLIFRSTKSVLLDTIPYFFAASFPIVLVNSFNLEIRGNVFPDISQFITLAPFFLYAGLVRLLHAANLSIPLKVFTLVLYLSIGGFPAAVNRIANLKAVYSNNSQGHEYVSNYALGECLEKVPVQNSLLVTNDLRYPANNFWRTMMQMQIPGIFGHHMYAGNLRWEKYFVDKERFDVQESLVTGDVKSIEDNAKLFGWTHGVFFKRKEFVRGDWPVVCENSEVVIVSFETVNDMMRVQPSASLGERSAK